MADSLPTSRDYLPPGLTPEEGNYIYNVEVLGLSSRLAAREAGISLETMRSPHIIQARELVRREIQGDIGFTREDVLFGLKEAINLSMKIAEPASAIAGYDRVIKMMGYDAPKKIDVNFTASVEAVKDHVRGLSDAELVRALDAGSVIDGEFYEVGK